MYPQLFAIGQVSIPTFGVLFIVGLFLGAFYIFKTARSDVILIIHNMTEEAIIDILLASLFIGFIGARMLFILTHIGAFGLDPLRWILFTYFPGLNVLGALYFGMGFLFSLSKTRKIPFLVLLDVFAGGFLLSGVFGFLGSYLGERVSDLPIALIQAVLLFLLFMGGAISKQRKIIRKDGLLGLTFLIIFAIVSCVLDAFKYDRSVLWFISIHQILFFILGVAATIALIRLKREELITLLRKFNLVW